VTLNKVDKQQFLSFIFGILLSVTIHFHSQYLQEGLAVARIARDDGSSSTNRSSDGYDQLLAVTQLRVTHFVSYALFRYALRRYARQLRKFCYAFIRRPLRSIRGAILGWCGNYSFRFQT